MYVCVFMASHETAVYATRRVQFASHWTALIFRTHTFRCILPAACPQDKQIYSIFLNIYNIYIYIFFHIYLLCHIRYLFRQSSLSLLLNFVTFNACVAINGLGSCRAGTALRPSHPPKGRVGLFGQVIQPTRKGKTDQGSQSIHKALKT